MVFSESLQTVSRYRDSGATKFGSFQGNCGFYVEEPDLPTQEVGLETGSSAFQPQSVLLNSVRQALSAVAEDNLFEHCVLCGQPIPEEQLQESPWAAACAACDLRNVGQDLCFELALAA